MSIYMYVSACGRVCACVSVCLLECVCVLSCLNGKHIEGQWAMCAELGQRLPRQLWLAALINLWPHRVIGHKKEIIRH